ncbi:MAG: FAD-binding protein [Bacteroidales bacterium]|nr:FAD-binding protein [Bacteroidales bacterium]
MSTEEIFDVIVVGGGAAGLTAGIYSSRARLSTLILNEGSNRWSNGTYR